MVVVSDNGFVDFIEVHTSEILDADRGEKVEETDVSRDIAGALNRWNSHTLDAEILHNRSEMFRQIEDLLRRQQQDGFYSSGYC